ncbi:hypothetical protein BgiBS90_023856 [Biomphalaria glabrata]|nr:hypothetical protein BgiBS90_023856 [Biomphalaria glabrata]
MHTRSCRNGRRTEIKQTHKALFNVQTTTKLKPVPGGLAPVAALFPSSNQTSVSMMKYLRIFGQFSRWCKYFRCVKGGGKPSTANTSQISHLKSHIISNPTSQISHLKSHISHLKSQISNLTSYISNLTSQISLLKSHISNLTSQISHLKSHISNLTSQVSHLKSHISNLTS